MTDDDDLPMQEYRRAGLEITRGNPEVYKSLWSRRDDVTLAPIAIRATTVFRREEGNWKVTHRHGDPITSMRPAESVPQR